ncbi:MAG: hydroxyisourate hydrolase [Woeseiaceae bacterium]|nr:hydroxyisourate hydrolase [Woeseiaceae bacterium]
MAGLTTHVLDTANGVPASGVAIRLYKAGERHEALLTTSTNDDGRTDAPLLAGDAMQSGTYELEFDIGDYFRGRGAALAEPAFLDTVVLRFAVTAGEHYHVPLLASPWSYSTYRGS